MAEGGTSGGGVTKFFERRLREQSSGPRLIEYPPRINVQGHGGGRFGGRSCGPYRLGVAPPRLHVDVEVCWAFLLGRLEAVVSTASDFDDALGSARLAAEEGRFSCARGHAEQGLRLFYLVGAPGCRTPRDRLVAAGEAWHTLANIEMEMGMWLDGLHATHRARQLFTVARSREQVAQTWQLEAHLLGQRDDGNFKSDAAMAARNALDNLDSASKGSRARNRGYYVGVLGQRLSRLGHVQRASRKLTFAFQAAQDAGTPRWASIWAARLAQNYIRAQDLDNAERSLCVATDLRAHLTPAGNAVLVRATAELLIAARRWDEAEVWVERALQIGYERSMQNQVRRAEELRAALERWRSR